MGSQIFLSISLSAVSWPYDFFPINIRKEFKVKLDKSVVIRNYVRSFHVYVSYNINIEPNDMQRCDLKMTFTCVSYRKLVIIQHFARQFILLLPLGIYLSS